MPKSISSPPCPECGNPISPNEYVEVNVTMVRGDMRTPIGVDMYCAPCWLELSEGTDDN
jgi:hypothetical protein